MFETNADMGLGMRDQRESLAKGKSSSSSLPSKAPEVQCPRIRIANTLDNSGGTSEIFKQPSASGLCLSKLMEANEARGLVQKRGTSHFECLSIYIKRVSTYNKERHNGHLPRGQSEDAANEHNNISI